jgi:uncharacterized protein
MNNKMLYKDPNPSDNNVLPDLIPVTINSNNAKMFGVMFTAAGEGPHPTMLLLHGFPGNERNFDLAHAFRRAGWNVLIFHYRGTWGSHGNFSFSNALDDIKAALEFLKSEVVGRKYRIDNKNIVLAGNSVGGFATLLTAASGADVKGVVSISSYDLGVMGDIIQKDEKTKKTLRKMFEECVEPTQGATVEGLIDEITVNSEKWNLINNASKLAKHNILIIAGSRDEVSLPEMHYCPLIDALLLNNAEKLEYHLLNSDHGFQDKRILLTEIIGKWLDKVCSEEND